MNIEFYLHEFVSWILSTIQIANIESFAITIFGIGITVFTVLYSFISSKYDMIGSLRDKINNGGASIEEQTQYNIAIRYIQRQKRNNVYSIIVCGLSFGLFLLCKIKELFFNGSSLFQCCLAILYIVLILLIVFLTLFVLKEYLRQIEQ